MIKQIFIILMFSLFLNAQDEEGSSALIKQKIEIKELKKELNDFYNEKEKEYQDRKKELDNILAKIEKEKKDIQEIQDKNLSILQDIKQTVASKTAKIYNAMKPKEAASIFNQMIAEGKIEDVFAIILKLKEKNITLLMKFLSVENAALLTQMLQNYTIENDKKE